MSFLFSYTEEEETRQMAQKLNIKVAQKPPEFMKPLAPYVEFKIGEVVRLVAS